MTDEETIDLVKQCADLRADRDLWMKKCGAKDLANKSIHKNPNELYPGYAGLTLREYFAGQALAGFTANPAQEGCKYWEFADMSVKQADALIAELEKTAKQ